MTEQRPTQSPGDQPGSEAAPARLDVRAPYEPPTLEHLGPWQAFTLQQSVPIEP